MLQALLLVGVVGSIVAAGVSHYQRNSSRSKQQVVCGGELIKFKELTAHMLEDLDSELDWETRDEAGSFLLIQPLNEPAMQPVEFHTLMKPKAMATIPEEPELELGLDAVEKYEKEQPDKKQLSPTSFDRLFDALWSGARRI